MYALQNYIPDLRGGGARRQPQMPYSVEIQSPNCTSASHYGTLNCVELNTKLSWLDTGQGSASPGLGLHVCTPDWASLIGSGDQTNSVLMLARQILYQLNYLPSSACIIFLNSSYITQQYYSLSTLNQPKHSLKNKTKKQKLRASDVIILYLSCLLTMRLRDILKKTKTLVSWFHTWWLLNWGMQKCRENNCFVKSSFEQLF